MVQRRSRSSCSGGFTLVEILVSLAVVSIGTTILVSLFTSSLALAQSSRNQSVAAGLAEEQLQALLRNPDKYEWHLQNAAQGQLVEVTGPGGGPGTQYPFKPPLVLPVEPFANAREEHMYEGFSWQAYAKLPSADAPYIEVTVVVRWTESGRPKVFALTSCASRAALAGGTPLGAAEGST